MRFRALPLFVLLALALVGSCTSRDASTGVDETVLPAGVMLRPAVVPSPANATARPISRIRAVTAAYPSNLVLGDTTVVVDPEDASWELDLGVVLSTSPIEAVVFLYLMHQDDASAPTVEFSGRTDPFTLRRGQMSEPADAPIVRGPLANLYVTDLGATPPESPLIQGETIPLVAVPQLAVASTSAPRVYWTSLDTTVVTVDSATAFGVTPGAAPVIASAGALADTFTVDVVIPPVDSVRVVPDSANVVLGQSRTFAAELRDLRDRVVTGREVRWSIGDTTIAVVDSLTGEVSTRALGATTVTATSEGVSDAAVVTVTLVPVDSVAVTPAAATIGVDATLQFSAEAYDSVGGVLSGRAAAWISSVPAVATIDSTGLATGLSVGTTMITATVEGVSATAALTVGLPSADVVRWSRPGQGGSWQDPGNWDGGVIPGPGDSVVIANAGGTITIDADVDIDHLEMTGDIFNSFTISHDANTVTIRESIATGVFTSYFLFGSAVLSGDHTATFGGALNFDGGTYAGAGVTTLTGLGGVNVWQGAGRTLSERVIVNQAGLSWATGSITPTNNGTINNAPGGTLFLSGAVTFGESVGTTIVNQGTIVRDNTGGQATIFAELDNEGLVRVTIGSLVLAGDGFHTGNFEVFDGTLLNFTSIADHTIEGTVSGAGAVNFGTGVSSVTGDFAVAGLSFNGGVSSLVSFQGGFPATLDSVVVQGFGELQLSSSDTVEASLVKVTSGFFTGTSHRVALDSAHIGSATFLGGSTEVTSGAGAIFDGGARTFDNTSLTIGGDARWLAGDTDFTDGDLTIGSTGTLTVENAVQLSTLGSGAGLVVDGALRVLGDLGTDAALTVAGSIEVTDATLDANGTFLLAPDAVVTGNAVLDLTDVASPDLSGRFAPGDPDTGTLDVLHPSPVLGSTSRIEIDIGGLIEGAERDMVRFDGDLSVDGTLVVDTLNGFEPAPGQSFPVLVFGSRTGTFADVQLPSIAGVALDTVWAESGTTDTLYVVASAAGGDAAPLVQSVGRSGSRWNEPDDSSPAGGPRAVDAVVMDLVGTYTVKVDSAVGIDDTPTFSADGRGIHFVRTAATRGSGPAPWNLDPAPPPLIACASDRRPGF